MNSTDTKVKLSAILARATTETLLGSLVIMDSVTKLDEAERAVYAWTCDEIERRHPALSAYIDAAMDKLDDARTYGQIIADGLMA